jgi:hypothetical protein
MKGMARYEMDRELIGNAAFDGTDDLSEVVANLVDLLAATCPVHLVGKACLALRDRTETDKEIFILAALLP